MCTVIAKPWHVLAFVAAIMTTASCSEPENTGVGFITSYGTEQTGTRYYPYSTPIPNSPNFIYESRTDSGQQWMWSMGGTQGGAPDARGLPEWVEFKWQEVPLELRRSEGNERTREEVLELFRKLPIKTYRVEIRSRIPQEVVDEIKEARRKREKNKLPKKMLWLEFTWVGDEVKLGWKITAEDARGVDVVMRKGGDLFD
jgi:hypothetical protein